VHHYPADLPIRDNRADYNWPVTLEKHLTDSVEVQIGDLLRARGLKLTAAESCTGGLIASRITDVPGSSDYFLGGVVAYSYEAKVAVLGVSWDTLRTYGAVSREAVIEMARGVLKVLEADVALAVSGIAGPGGGLPNKPVGTTWVGLSTRQGAWARLYCFAGTRWENKSSSADAALQMLTDYLKGTLPLDGDFREAIP
jgi:PncC family amidohydrolase